MTDLTCECGRSWSEGTEQAISVEVRGRCIACSYKEMTKEELEQIVERRKRYLKGKPISWQRAMLPRPGWYC